MASVQLASFPNNPELLLEVLQGESPNLESLKQRCPKQEYPLQEYPLQESLKLE